MKTTHMKPMLGVLAPILIAGLAVVPASHGPGTMSGHGHGTTPGHGPGQHFERLLLHLDLSSAQRQSIAELLEANRAEKDALAVRIEDAHETLHEAMLAEPLDQAAIRGAATAVGDLLSERAIAHATLLAEVRALLTPDQRRRMVEIFDQSALSSHGPQPWR